MPNLYQQTAEPAPDTGALNAQCRADVVIIGGGVTGLSTALHLAERGVKVILLEAEEPGWGASGRNGGQVNAGLKPDPDVVERDFGADLGGRMNAYAGAAPAFVFELIQRHAIRCEARQNGTLRAATRPAHAAKVRASAEQLLRRGAPVELLDRAATARATGTEAYLTAMLDRRGGDLNPLSFARGLARVAMSLGATVHRNSRVLGLERMANAWRARTASGCVTAERVLLATNGYTDGLWPGLRRSVVPIFGAIAATEVLAEPIARQVMPSRCVLYESGAVTVYYRIDAGGRLLIGGRGPMREIQAAAAIPHLLKYARALWPALNSARWTHAWGGRLAMTQDHYPHVHEPAEGVLVCLGYNGRGVALGTALGAQLSDRLIDRAARFDMPITPLKPIPLHALWPLAVRAAIARGRLSDYLGI